MKDNDTPNPTIPILPSEPITLIDALKPLFEPPIPEMVDFLKDGWALVDPDSAEGQIKMLWLRYKQTSVALAAACREIEALKKRIENGPPVVQ